jgi:3-isopropylmalate/(R)-2-methylmalate dehydratase small subunit
MDAKFCGSAWSFGDNIDTDMIIPARFMSITNYEELGKHCLTDTRPEFTENAKTGDILVAGKNFGCGSSRENAPVAIRARGISCVVAESFARTFFRNAVNMCFYVVELPRASERIREGDIIQVDIKAGKVANKTTNEEYDIEPIPEFMLNMYEIGGLSKYIQNRLKTEGCQREQTK